jgi:multicomponent Na+:H+ antiporter subunit D
MVLMPYAYRSVETEIVDRKIPVFYCLYLLCISGLLGILSTNDIFNLYVFLEISSLATYALIAMGRDRRALTASFSYLILGTIGATFILIAIGLLYIMTGTLNLTDMVDRLPEIYNTPPVIGAFAFLTIGVMLKIALFPLHIWLTNAYAYAPSFVSAFLSATATKVSLYVFLRFILSLFGYEFSFKEIPLSHILMILSVVAIVAGSISAIYNPNVKRLLAFSSVAQVGYITLMISLATKEGFTAAVLHIANHGFAKALLFASAGGLVYLYGKVRLYELYGKLRENKIILAGIVVGGLSIIGVPGTAGFVSKWYMITALLAKESYLLIALVIVSSGLAIIYIWRIVEALYFRKSEAKDTSHEAVLPMGIQASIIILIFANIYFGLFTDATYHGARLAVEAVL